MADIGLIDLTVIHLRACLDATLFGAEDDGINPAGARVFACADIQRILDGEPKPTGFNSVYVIPGTTLTVEPVGPGSNDVTIKQIESVNIAVLMDASADVWGEAPAIAVHAIRKNLWSCLHGWSPQVAAGCLDLDIGYHPEQFASNGDSPYDIDQNRYIHQFQYVVPSWISQQNQGFGDYNACNIEDLLRIYADYNLDTAIDEDNPVLKSRNDFPAP